jgi:hypothetical protein
MCSIEKIEMQAIRGSNDMGYIAIDNLDMIQIGLCPFEPKEAIPTTTTSTTSPTTPEPTEPPDRN